MVVRGAVRDSMREASGPPAWWHRWIWPTVLVVALGAVLVVLRQQLEHVQVGAILAAARGIPLWQVVASVLLTFLAFAAVPSYDALALQYVGQRIPLYRSALGSIITYAISQSLGFQAVTGNAIRYRLWSSWGVSAPEIARAAGFSTATFTFGLVSVAGLSLTLEPSTVLAALRFPAGSGRTVGIVLLLVPTAYLFWVARTSRRTVAIRDWTIAVPGPGMAIAQLVVAFIDWAVAGSVLFVLLPAGHPLTLPAFLGAFVIAQSAGLVSHVPGGLGVFELVILALLGPHVHAAQISGALIVYRAVYYLMPLGFAVLALAYLEARRHSTRIVTAAKATAAIASRWSTALLPEALGLLVFAGGAGLLLAGALPISRHGTILARGLVPLPLKEASHFLGSLAGVVLLVLAWAAQQRLDGAYRLSVAVLSIGAGAAMVWGAPPILTVLLLVTLATTWLARSAFTRRSALTAEPFGPSWAVAVAAVVGATLWLGLFSFRHVEYSGELWWRFTEDADAPRFLRASAGVAAALLAFGVFRLLRHARPAATLLSAEDRATIEALARAAPHTAAQFALLGDKRFLLAPRGEGFLMYGVRGRAWVALGDPVGPPEVQHELAWRFREEAARHGGWPVFYEVSAAQLPLYVDLGLALMKIGEEARVPLTGFTLEGGARTGLRRTVRVVEAAGAQFAVLPASEVPALLPELRAISDEWLAARQAKEKGFSLGRFDPVYLSRFAVAVVRVDGRVVAFANVLQSGDRAELSPDLMRYGAGAPPGVMEYLFTALMLWGAAQGFAEFNLGMAPLAGLEARASAPLISRAGDFLFRHGDSFYGFAGLRAFKEKFHPEWSPRYLVAPGGFALPRVLANVALLIGGGERRSERAR